MKQLPNRVKLARLLLFGAAALWVIIGMVSLARLAGGIAGAAPTVVALLMFGCAAVFAGLAMGIGHRSRSAYVACLLWLLANMALSVTDQVGAADLMSLFINALAFVLLLSGRSSFWRSNG